MGDLRVSGHDDADGGVRPRRAAGLRSHDDPRLVSVTDVVLYHAEGCHLCGAARRVLEAARAEVAFDYAEIDIGGDPELEARYRELLPVVEIDGERAFTYFVHPAALRRKLAQARASRGTL